MANQSCWSRIVIVNKEVLKTEQNFKYVILCSFVYGLIAII